MHSTNPLFPKMVYAPDPKYTRKGDIEPWDPKTTTLIDARPWHVVLVDKVKAAWVFIKCAILMMIENIKISLKIKPDTSLDLTNVNVLNSLDNKKSNKDLYVFIPGLGASAVMWVEYVKEIETAYKKLGKEADIRVVKNRKDGNQSFEETITPIKKMLQTYCKRNPTNRIVLVGTSLGALSSSYLEEHLRNVSPTNAVFVGSITGAYGSKMVSKLAKFPLAKLFLNPDLLERFSHKNEHTKALVLNQRKELPKNCERAFVYYAGMDETTVTPPSNEHPRMDNSSKVKHYNVYGACHVSTTKIVTKHLCERAIAFHKS